MLEEARDHTVPSMTHLPLSQLSKYHMASSASSPLRLSLSKYARIPEVLTLLETCGLLKTLSLSYGEAVARLRKSDPSRLREDKDVLKLISSQLIDEVYKTLEGQGNAGEASPGMRETTTSQKSDLIHRATTAEISQFSKGEKGQTRRKSESARSHPLSKSQGSMQSHIQPTDDKLVSEFNSIVGPATFTKQKRRIGDANLMVPGPGAYNTDPELVKSQSPRAVIPISGQRVDFLLPTSPGPAAYIPLRHFIAKRR